MAIPIELNELEGKPELGDNILSGTMPQSAGKPQTGNVTHKHSSLTVRLSRIRPRSRQWRKLQPRVKPVTVQRIGRRDLHRMICESTGMEQRPADEA